MTSDRERIAREIYEKARPKSAAVWEETGAGYRGRFYAQADAVLDAIGDRLMPELPDGWSVDRAFTDNGRSHVYLVRGTGIGSNNWLHGGGPTIPEAIRNALEGEKA